MNTLELDKVDIKAPIPERPCGSFSLSYPYCEQGALHPSPQELDWSSEDWDGTKAKARDQNKSLIDFSDSKPQIKTKQTMDSNGQLLVSCRLERAICGKNH